MNFDSLNQPLVSIIIPCRNEEKYIASCLDSLIENNYIKERVEILCVDGQSDDSTRKIVNTYIERFNFIQLLDNPQKIFPTAVNIGVNASKGELIFIVGAHAQYNKDYISKCVENSLKYNADNIGGVLITQAQNKSFIGNIITAALSSSFGVGNATFRTGSEKVMEVDTVFGGCYKRDVFNRIGLLNENLISTSDYEFNKRLRRNGGKIILVPDIKVIYYTRTTFQKFIVNNFRNGYWSIYPIRFVDYIPVALRHLIPLFFFMAIIGSVALSLFWSQFMILLLSILVLYLVVAIFFSIKTTSLKKIILLPLFFFTLHFSYGFGAFIALVKILIFKTLSSRIPKGNISL